MSFRNLPSRYVFSIVTISLKNKYCYRYTLSLVRPPIRGPEGNCGASRGCQGLAERDRLLGREPAHAM